MEGGQGRDHPSTNRKGMLVAQSIVSDPLKDLLQMHFPVSDVVKNFRYFLNVVKEATGNLAIEEDRSSKGANKKPRAYITLLSSYARLTIHTATAITRVILSSRQGPGIEIKDA